ncbi:hypothetical protein ACS0TY_017089 [Phlomoides rotata]
MASGTLGDSSDDLNWRGGIRWSENSIVYRRRTQKKAKKPSNNNDTATPTASGAEKPISAAAASPNQIPTLTEVESATVSTTSPAVVPAVSTSENPTNHAAVSPPSPSSLATTTSPHGTAGDHGVQGSLEGTRDVDSFEKVREHSPQEQSLSHGSHDKNAGSSPQPPQTQLEHQHVSSELDDGIKKDLPNGRKVSTAQLPIGNEEHDEGLMSGSPEVPQGNGLVNVNGVEKPTGNEAENDGETMPGSSKASQGNGLVNANGVAKPLVISSFHDRIRFNLCKATPKNEIMELRNNLESELDQVRKLVRQLESKELQIASYNSQIGNTNLSNSSNYVGAEGANISGYGYPQPQHVRSNVVDRRLLVRVNSEIGGVGHQEIRPMGLSRVNSDMGAARNLEPRVYNRQLSVAVMENNNRPGEFVEKEKRTPKANQYYRNSEFLLGKDRLPSESNKRLKTSNGRKHSGETDHSMGYGFGFDKSRNQVFKNCSSLLQRLMKHKFGWVFNEPVNAKALGLVDYHDIIKHPMDLGTIKTKMSQNQYQSPREFAEDVRLVFHNAMTYNPKGQDVHFMAEQLLQIFDERWGVIEAEYNPYRKYQAYQDGGLHTHSSRKALPSSHFSAPVTSPAAAASVPFYVPAVQMTSSMAVDHKIHRPHVGRTPVPKKPKAKDPNKRDMTYDEKQRLSTNLQGLPPEKLDAIVQIIKKRSTALSQHDDEIEVDIDNVDAETLWELDRFVTNYKKSLSKNKRKAELALQARTLANQNVTNSNPPAEAQIESGAAFEKRTALADGEKRAFNGSRSSSSSSSSSDSGSSSSDSDSDSSSGDGSDAGQSPKT